jgi:hypothetical protein
MVLRKIGQPTPLPELTTPPAPFESTPLPAPPPPASAAQSTRPPAHNSPSVPPVVATVITPLSTVLDAPRVGRGSSSLWKGIVGGAALGLAVVGVVVIGARAVQRGESHAGAAAPPAAVASALQGVASRPAQPAAPPLGTIPASTDPGPPVIAATALPLAPAARWNPPVGPAHPGSMAPPGVKPVSAAPAVAAVVPPPAALEPSPSPASTSVSPPPAASAASEPAPEDTAASLVPVLPPSAPPVVDPLVQAVQTDIAEEQKAKHR